MIWGWINIFLMNLLSQEIFARTRIKRLIFWRTIPPGGGRFIWLKRNFKISFIDKVACLIQNNALKSFCLIKYEFIHVFVFETVFFLLWLRKIRNIFPLRVKMGSFTQNRDSLWKLEINRKSSIFSPLKFDIMDGWFFKEINTPD